MANAASISTKITIAKPATAPAFALKWLQNSRHGPGGSAVAMVPTDVSALLMTPARCAG